MKWIRTLLFRRWLLICIGLVALAVLVWWVGPTISISNFYPYESEIVRYIQIAMLFLTPLAKWAWGKLKARRASTELATGLVKTEGQAERATSEVATLRRRFEEALGLLRRRHFGTERPSLWSRLRALGSAQYLYELPWYVFIGAPGAGKTTALVNSGLRFPLSDRLGVEAVRGVGGTRDCDWWFTDDAVFLDTAGRYTTQESQKEVDAGAWKGFLQLLKKSRPRRPINGALVTVSVGDLLQQTQAERDAHVVALRSRIRELYADLGVRFPVYVLVTKADLLAGFSETFAGLGREERAQVWGFSLPYAAPALDLSALGPAFEALERRLYDRLPEALEEEREPTRRALIYGFPQQFALLRERLVEFIDATFAPSQFDRPALLRGVYFTSGTQEGSPIDRVMGALARNLGLERRLLPAQHDSGRSYFLTRLLREVVFPEAGLAGLDPRVERRRGWVQRGIIAASVLALVVVPTAWWISYRNNLAYLEEVRAHADEVKKQVGAIQAGARSDLGAILPTLTAVRSLPETPATAGGSAPWSYRFGLYQGRKIEAASRAAYRRMLQDTFFPTMVAHLDRSLRDSPPDRSEDAYDALKVYAMIYEPKRFNRDFVWRWLEARREQFLPGAGPAELKSLKSHFDNLYERGWVEPAVAKDEALLAGVRARVGREALPKRIYDRLRQEPPGDLKDFTVADKIGPRAMLVFERQSREPLTKGVPALYTKDGFYKSFTKRVDVVATQLAEEETWVLGTGRGAVAGLASAPSVGDSVRRLYLEDYQRTWRQFVNDLQIIKDRDLNRTIEIARTLSATDGPLKPLVKAIDRETSLSIPPEGEAGLAGAVSDKAQQYIGKARQAITGTAMESMIKSLVDDQFDDIRRLAGAGGTGPAPIDGMVQQINEFYTYLVAAKVALDSAQQLPQDGSNKLRAEAGRLPEPVRSMMLSLVDGSSKQIGDRVRVRQQEEAKQALEKQTQDLKAAADKQAADDKLAREKDAAEQKLAREKKLAEYRMTRDRLDADMRAQVGDFCGRAIGGRYPFVRTSTQDVTPEDFARLFSPSGIIDGFFQKNLAPLVDTSQSTWQFRDPLMGQSKALAEFQRAQVIRDVFFRGGGNSPNISLEFKPVEMDATISQFTLDVDGKIVRYAHGPQVPVRVQFPGPSGRSQVRVTIAPPAKSGSSGIKFEGPWALFRMFDGVKIEETNQYERFLAAITVDGRRAVFEILASSVKNPFRLPELTQFHCPTAL